MSNCGCATQSDCNPCVPASTTQESVASYLDNLTLNLFGELTKTIVNGRAVWSTPCTASGEISCQPRNEGEGFICYILRLMADIGVWQTGVWDINESYCKHSMVGNGDSLYLSILDVPVGINISNTTYWTKLLTAPAGADGATGPQGPAGASGGGSAINYAIRSITISDSALNTDAVMFCTNAAPIVLTLQTQASYDSGKWFIVTNTTGNAVVITPSGGQTINGAATYTLASAEEAVHLVSNNTGDWRIV